jgi:hypothetical protein
MIKDIEITSGYYLAGMYPPTYSQAISTVVQNQMVLATG